jgi:nucleoid DNA-binding protein/nucleoid-associated protein YgaU
MSEKITFKELVELIAEQSKQSQNSTSSFVSELVQVIEGGLKKSGSVSISGFGKFELRWMKERSGVNPQTGESITIPGQNKVVFKPYKALREDVNRPYAKMQAQILESGGSAKKESADSDIPNKETPKKKEPLVLSSPPEEDDEDSSDLIVERPIPVKETLPADDDFIDSEPVAEEEEKHVKESVDIEKLIPPPPPKKADLDESKLAEEVQKAGTLNWSYVAAAILVALIIVALMLLIRESDDTTQPIASTQTEQLEEPADQVSVTPDSEVVEEGAPSPTEGPPFEMEEYQIQQGQSLWTIAEAQLGNPYLWPLIYETNRGQFDNPNYISPDATIVIPVIQDPENLTHAQLEQVALGYLSIYEWTAEVQPDQARYFLWAVGVFSPEVLSKAENNVNSADWAFANRR